MTYAPSPTYPDALPTNIERRLQSFVNRGIVTEVDHQAVRCRVQVDGVHTDWLAWASPRMGHLKIWCPPKVGEQVMLISETGELSTALVTHSFDYNSEPMPAHDPNTIEMHVTDGAVFRYNHATHNLEVNLPNESTTKLVSNHIKIAADNVSIDCDRYSVACNGYDINCGTYNLNGELIINDTPYRSHTHRGVKSGDSSTGGING